jgi:hypothetical protein
MLSSGGRALYRDITRNQKRGRRLLKHVVRRSLLLRCHDGNQLLDAVAFGIVL